jgi:hypothetical protein
MRIKKNVYTIMYNVQVYTVQKLASLKCLQVSYTSEYISNQLGMMTWVSFRKHLKCFN